MTNKVKLAILNGELEVNKVDLNSKWYRTRLCGCGECRNFSMTERPECPMRLSPTAKWLWAINPKFIGCKDYVDPYGPDIFPVLTEGTAVEGLIEQ